MMALFFFHNQQEVIKDFIDEVAQIFIFFF